MDAIEKLVQERRMRHITQSKVASHLNITPSTLWRYETKQRLISYDLFVLYADYLGYEIKITLKE